MSSDKEFPSVSRVSESQVKRQVQGVFHYSLATKKLRAQSITLACLGVMCLAAVLAWQGKPSKDARDERHPPFHLPSLSNHEKSPISDPSQYSRANDAQSQLEKKKNQGSRTRSKAPERQTLSGPMLILPPKDVKIPLGSTIKAVLLSGGANGWVKAAVKTALTQNGETLLEAGSVLMGRGTSTEDRLFIQFTKLIHRDGAVDPIEAEAADASDESMGLKGSRLGSRATKLAASIGLNFITGAAEALQETQGSQGVVIRSPSAKNAVLQGTARASLDESQEVMQEMKNAHPQITVPVGTEFLVTFTGDGRS